MRILFLSRWFPYPADNGSKLRVLNLLKQLAMRHSVHLISFTSEPINSEQCATLRQWCEQVEAVAYRPFQPQSWRAWMGFLDARPRSVVATLNAEMSARVRQAVQQHAFDVVIASQIDMAPYALPLRRCLKVLEELELTSLYEPFIRSRRLRHRLRAGLTWWKLKQYTAHLLNAFDLCTVVSDVEQMHVRAIGGRARIEVVPNGIDPQYYAGNFGPPEPNRLIYSGALTYTPNLEAVDFFLREIFPRIQASCPSVRFYVTGKLDGVPVDKLPPLPGLTFTGYLDDVRPAVAQSWVSVVPLRSGGGTRLKILESLALGTPVVSTSKGAEGLGLVPEHDLLIADDPVTFAHQIVRILQEPRLRSALGARGRRTVISRFDWAHLGADFVEHVEYALARSAVVA